MSRIVGPCLNLVLLGLALLVQSSFVSAQAPPPVAPIPNVVAGYFGTKVTDPSCTDTIASAGEVSLRYRFL